MGDQLNLAKLLSINIISLFFFFVRQRNENETLFGSGGNAAIRKYDWFVDICLICRGAIGSVEVDVSSALLISLLLIIKMYCRWGFSLHAHAGMHFI